MKQAEMTRRGALRLSAKLGSGSVMAISPAGRLLAQPSIQMPDMPMRLTRRLSRGLRDGSAIVVTRNWRITFAPQARGIAINGEQTGVTVDAPPVLKTLTEIEANRSTAGMFPILLSPTGTIVAAGEMTSRTSIDAGMRQAVALFEQRKGSAQTKEEQIRVLARLRKTGTSLLDEMPGDLFYPSVTPLREVRSLNLPDGSTGEFEIGWEATHQTGSTLLKSARRKVITRIGSSIRISSEDWSLEAL